MHLQASLFVLLQLSRTCSADERNPVSCCFLLPGFDSKCLGNILFVDVGPLGGRHLEVAGVLSKLKSLIFFIF